MGLLEAVEERRSRKRSLMCRTCKLETARQEIQTLFEEMAAKVSKDPSWQPPDYRTIWQELKDTLGYPLEESAFRNHVKNHLSPSTLHADVYGDG